MCADAKKRRPAKTMQLTSKGLLAWRFVMASEDQSTSIFGALFQAQLPLPPSSILRPSVLILPSPLPLFDSRTTHFPIALSHPSIQPHFLGSLHPFFLSPSLYLSHHHRPSPRSSTPPLPSPYTLPPSNPPSLPHTPPSRPPRPQLNKAPPVIAAGGGGGGGGT